MTFNVSWFWNNGNIRDVLKMLETTSPPLFHICNGCSGIGNIRLDKTVIEMKENHIAEEYQKYIAPCNVRGDFNHLPFKDGVAGSVICDPPYDYNFTDETLINELVRISKPKAKIIFIAPWIPRSPVIKIITHDLWIVGKKRPYYKVASMFFKSNGQIGDYV
ncbi:MAG: hypothetical protein Q8M94_05270 [Ignavibacteria bacterium]|nr:hypothetical protein [Ignavibacteria bacterium]